MSEIQLHLGDCLEVMKGIPDKSIDMILCDLPYGTTQNKKDKRIDLKALWKEYRRIIKDNGCIALFAQGKFYIDLAMSNYKWFRYDLIWDKKLTSGFLNAKRMPMRRHEQVAIFYKKPPVYNPQFTKGQPLHSKGTKYKTKVQTNNNYGKYGAPANDRAGSTDKYPTSILEVAKPHPSTAQHSTEKPVALCEWLIKTYTNKGNGNHTGRFEAYNSLCQEPQRRIFTDLTQGRRSENKKGTQREPTRNRNFGRTH